MQGETQALRPDAVSDLGRVFFRPVHWQSAFEETVERLSQAMRRALYGPAGTSGTDSMVVFGSVSDFGLSHGAVAAITYYSTALKGYRRMHIYTPPG